ncbi:MAG: helix-turn-helix domain-containing protein [Muribaculaceae bacterium]|nr:helix-turn-helix domain-containing protein [Muribaculaceae bacterium]
MSIVLIECRQIGRILRYARRQNHMRPSEMAQLLRISRTELRQYERGTTLISDAVLMRLMMYGVTLLKARYTRLKPDDKK